MGHLEMTGCTDPCTDQKAVVNLIRLPLNSQKSQTVFQISSAEGHFFMADVHFFRTPFPRRADQLKRARDVDDDQEEISDVEKKKQKQRAPPEDLEDAPEEPPPDFPHAPLKNGQKVSAAIRARPENVKRHHVAVLTTMLHKCMLDGEYIRAGRAFGMLLRLEMRGLKVDIRKDGLWGIGAEILLRRDTANPMEATTKTTWFSEEGYRAARTYYDRLILQYPHRRTHQYLVSSIHFNVPMFGIWIFQVQERSQKLLQSLVDGSSADEILAALGISLPDDEGSIPPDMYETVKTWELEQARAIQDHIVRLMMGPPFDKDQQHQKLAGMISLWIADLLKATSKPAADVKVELSKAASCFKLSTKYGGTVWKEAELAAQPAPAENEESD